MATARQVIGRIRDIAVSRGLTEAEIHELDEEITDLRSYLMYIVKEHPETKSEIAPQIKAISYLLEPVSK